MRWANQVEPLRAKQAILRPSSILLPFFSLFAYRHIEGSQYRQIQPWPAIYSGEEHWKGGRERTAKDTAEHVPQALTHRPSAFMFDAFILISHILTAWSFPKYGNLPRSCTCISLPSLPLLLSVCFSATFSFKIFSQSLWPDLSFSFHDWQPASPGFPEFALPRPLGDGKANLIFFLLFSFLFSFPLLIHLPAIYHVFGYLEEQLYSLDATSQQRKVWTSSRYLVLLGFVPQHHSLHFLCFRFAFNFHFPLTLISLRCFGPLTFVSSFSCRITHSKHRIARLAHFTGSQVPKFRKFFISCSSVSFVQLSPIKVSYVINCT